MLKIHEENRSPACFRTSGTIFISHLPCIHGPCPKRGSHAVVHPPMRQAQPVSCREMQFWKFKIERFKTQGKHGILSVIKKIKGSVQFGVICLKSSCVPGCLQAWQRSEVPTMNGCVETAYAVWLWWFSKSLKERTQWSAVMDKEMGERPQYSPQRSCLCGKPYTAPHSIGSWFSVSNPQGLLEV